MSWILKAELGPCTHIKLMSPCQSGFKLFTSSHLQMTSHPSTTEHKDAPAEAREMQGSATTKSKHSAKKAETIKQEILAIKNRIRLREQSQRITQEMLDSIISL